MKNCHFCDAPHNTIKTTETETGYKLVCPVCNYTMSRRGTRLEVIRMWDSKYLNAMEVK